MGHFTKLKRSFTKLEKKEAIKTHYKQWGSIDDVQLSDEISQFGLPIIVMRNFYHKELLRI